MTSIESAGCATREPSACDDNKQFRSTEYLDWTAAAWLPLPPAQQAGDPPSGAAPLPSKRATHLLGLASGNVASCTP